MIPIRSDVKGLGAVAVSMAVLAVGCASDSRGPAGSDVPEAGSETTEAFAPLPVPRTEVAGTRWIDRIAVVGGLTGESEASSLAHVWEPTADVWDPLPELPLGLHHTAVVSFDDRLWVIGGYTVDGDELFAPVDRVFSLGVGEEAWTEEPPLPAPRGALAATVADGRIVAAGGVDPDGDVLATSLFFDPAEREWTEGPAMAVRREHFAMATARGEVYAVAGRIGGIGNNHDTVEVLREGSDVWAPAPSLEHSRGGIGAASIEGVLCVAGGEEPDGTIAPVECLVDGAWEVVAELATPRHGLAVAAFVGRLHVIGGGPEPGLTVSDAHEVFEVP